MSEDSTRTRAGAGRLWPWRRRRRLAYLEAKVGNFESALAAQVQIFAALNDKLMRLEHELRTARQLHSRLRQEIDQLHRERAQAEDDARRLRRAVETQDAGLAELERAIERALLASPPGRRS
jgi:septation ring formation regulator EzrA